MGDERRPGWERRRVERLARPGQEDAALVELRRWIEAGDHERARSLLRALEAAAWHPSPDALESLVQLWLEAGRPDDAGVVLEIMRSRGARAPDEVWDRMVVAWAVADRPGRAQRVVDEMLRAERQVGGPTYDALMAAWARRGEPDRVQVVLRALQLAGREVEARHRRYVLESLAKAGRLAAAYDQLQTMWASEVAPGRAEYGVLLAACARVGDCELAGRLLAEMEARGVDPDAEMVEAAIVTYGRCGQIDTAEELFAAARALGRPTPGQWWGVMFARAHVGRAEAVEAILAEMDGAGATPQERHYRLVLGAARRGPDPEMAERVLRHAAARQVRLDLHGCVLAAETFASAGRPDDVREVIAAMWAWGPRPTKKLYRILLQAEVATKGGAGGEAVVEEMSQAGFPPRPGELDLVAEQLRLEGRGDAAEDLLRRWGHGPGGSDG